jgi:predicted kinase
MIVSASPEARDSFVDRLIETKGAVMSVGKVRGLLQGRVPEDQMDARAEELLDKAVAKRLEAGETVVIPAQGLDPEGRERYVRMAAALKRPRHLILVETARDQVQEEDRSALNELRRRLDAGEVGQEGFQTALRLGGGSVGELKRLVFRPAPRDD